MSCLYLGYRLFWALYFTMWAVWAWVGSMGYDSPAALKLYFMTYLTNWSIWTLALDTSIQAANVILHLKKISDDGELLSLFFRWGFKRVLGWGCTARFFS